MAKDDSWECDEMTDLLGMIATVSGWERDWECKVSEWMKLRGEHEWMKGWMNIWTCMPYCIINVVCGQCSFTL